LPCGHIVGRKRHRSLRIGRRASSNSASFAAGSVASTSRCTWPGATRTTRLIQTATFEYFVIGDPFDETPVKPTTSATFDDARKVGVAMCVAATTCWADTTETMKGELWVDVFVNRGGAHLELTDAVSADFVSSQALGFGGAAACTESDGSPRSAKVNACFLTGERAPEMSADSRFCTFHELDQRKGVRRGVLRRAVKGSFSGPLRRAVEGSFGGPSRVCSPTAACYLGARKGVCVQGAFGGP
jgi:hypothetical protein